MATRKGAARIVRGVAGRKTTRQILFQGHETQTHHSCRDHPDPKILFLDEHTTAIDVMAYRGFEKDCGTLKYRCPAKQYGYE